MSHFLVATLCFSLAACAGRNQVAIEISNQPELTKAPNTASKNPDLMPSWERVSNGLPSAPPGWGMGTARRNWNRDAIKSREETLVVQKLVTNEGKLYAKTPTGVFVFDAIDSEWIEATDKPREFGEIRLSTDLNEWSFSRRVPDSLHPRSCGECRFARAGNALLVANNCGIFRSTATKVPAQWVFGRIWLEHRESPGFFEGAQIDTIESDVNWKEQKQFSTIVAQDDFAYAAACSASCVFRSW